MDQTQLGERYHEDDVGATGGWPMSAEGYQSPHIISPGQEYQGFSFNASPVSVNPMYGTPTPPMPQQSFPPSWPSMLASHHHHGVPGQMHSAPQMAPMQPYIPPQPLPPLVTQAQAHPQSHQQPPQTQQPPPPPPQQSSARRTLTDQDRRRMCIFHEENPTVKQTEIGAMFGVERSTVSKVLRQKEKYLSLDDPSKSPIRRAKGKFPDIERALSNWANKHHQKGIHLTDDQIRDKARFFAASVGNPEASLKVSSPSWLEKFKQKNQIGGSKHGKAGTPTTAADLGNSTPNGISPISPAQLESSPLTPGGGERSFDGKADSPATDTSSVSRLLPSKSSSSLAGAYADSPSSFTAASQTSMPAPAKPTRPAQEIARMMPPSTTDSHRPRSQTFPMLGIEPTTIGQLTEEQMEEMMAGHVLETPHEEYPGRSLSVASISSTDLHGLPQSQTSSVADTPTVEHNPSLMGPPISSIYPGQAISGGMVTHAAHPTLDDGRRGLNMAMGFLTSLPSGVVDPQEFLVLRKLMEKLNGLGSPVGEMPGGMHPIDVKKEMSRKRSIQSL